MSLIEKNLHPQVHKFFKKNPLVPGCDIIVALSGGPDSVALLHILNDLKEEYSLNLYAAYVNHGIRESGDLIADDEFVNQICNDLGVKLFFHKVPPGELNKRSEKEGKSLEELARHIRYDFFSTLKNKLNSPYLLIGHNFDDQMETMISRFFQGSDIEGLKGIPHRNEWILRPLISIRKEEILLFLKKNSLSYRVDPSNSENDYLRNQIRNQILPLLEQTFPGLEKSLKKQEKRFNDLNDLIEIQSDELLITSNNSQCSVSLHKFNEANGFVRQKVLFKMFNLLYKGSSRDFRLPSAFFNPLLKGLIETNKNFAGAYNIFIHSDVKSLIMEERNSLEKGFYTIVKNNFTSIPNLYWIKKVEKSSIEVQVQKDSPLIFRSSHSSDYIVGEQGKKEIKKLLPKGISSVPVLEDSQGIVTVFTQFSGQRNFFRKKKINASQNFYILYLEVGKE